MVTSTGGRPGEVVLISRAIDGYKHTCPAQTAYIVGSVFETLLLAYMSSILESMNVSYRYAWMMLDIPWPCLSLSYTISHPYSLLLSLSVSGAPWTCPKRVPTTAPTAAETWILLSAMMLHEGQVTLRWLMWPQLTYHIIKITSHL